MLTKLLFFLSKTDTLLINKCDYEAKQSQASKGFFVLSTGLFWAAGTWYTLNLIYPGSWALCLLIAAILGSSVCAMDREIVSSTKKGIETAFFRICFCLLVGYIVAIPFKFELFQHRIEQEVQRVETQRNTSILLELNRRKDEFTTSINRRIQAEKREHEQHKTLAAEHKQAMILELYGDEKDSTWSGIAGRGEAYRLEKADAAYYEDLAAGNRREISKLEDRRQTFEAAIDAEYADRTSDEGFTDIALKYEALHAAASRSKAVFVLMWLYTLLFMAIETMPLMAKAMKSETKYDKLLKAEARKFDLLLEYECRLYDADLEKIKAEALKHQAPKEYYKFETDLLKSETALLG